MDLIVTLVVGGVIGWLASLIMGSDEQMGILANILVGVVGSVLGLWLAGLVGVSAAGGPARWIASRGSGDPDRARPGPGGSQPETGLRDKQRAPHSLRRERVGG